MSTCIVCQAGGSGVVYPGILRCSTCGHTFADLTVSDDELAALYRRSYFFGDEYRDYVADKAILQKNFKLRLKVLDRFVQRDRHRRLLEIGSAYGFFLELARERFAEVSGVDISEDGVRYAREVLGLDVTAGDFLKQELGDQAFDVVCMWDTIEHLRDPHLYLDKIGRHTAAGALLAITTGDVASLHARAAGSRWRLLHPPTHLHYFRGEGLRALLGRCGFDLVYSRYCGFYRSVDLAAHRLLTLRHGTSALYRMLGKLHILQLAFYLNCYDIRYVIAMRR